MQPVIDCTTVACGARASHSFIDPHSSASTWPNDTQRSSSAGITRATASDTSGNSLARPGVEQQWLVPGHQVLVEAEVHLGHDAS